MSGLLNDVPIKVPPVVERLERGEKMPICIIIVGMAGSGKTSLLSRLQVSLEQQQQEEEPSPSSSDKKEADNDNDTDNSAGADNTTTTQSVTTKNAYCVNLDPATIDVTYDVNIDIRDTINYKEVMKQHKLGPNGAIMTSLNLFTTKFDQVLSILEKRAYPTTNNNNDDDDDEKLITKNDNTDKEDENNDKDDDDDDEDDDDTPIDYILVDTPGQIEAFTWSASGTIISESLSSSFPTILCYVVDTVRCASSPNTFISNMLYACSMLYRTRLPIIICFNKIDVISHEFCIEWMKDIDTFQQALDDMAETSGFYGSLTRSLSLVLDEFYSNFVNVVGVSAVTGDGINEFWTTVQKTAIHDFTIDYIDDLKNRIEEQQTRQYAIARSNIRTLQNDIDHDNNNNNNNEEERL